MFRLSLFGPKPPSFFLATPITRTGTEPTRITSPTGLGLSAKSLARVLSSITATWARWSTALRSKVVPWASWMSFTRKYWSPTPVAVPVTATLP